MALEEAEAGAEGVVAVEEGLVVMTGLVLILTVVTATSREGELVIFDEKLSGDLISLECSCMQEIKNLLKAYSVILMCVKSYKKKTIRKYA